MHNMPKSFFCISLSCMLIACDTSFVVIGDAPYDDKDEIMLQEAINAISPNNARSPYPFVIHIGDYKASSEPCDDEIDARFESLIDELSPVPVFYTPGDNEWVDCDSYKIKPDTEQRSELARLKSIRTKFFRAHPANSAAFGYSSQTIQPENGSWHHARIRFITLHVTGTKTGREWVTFKGDDAVSAGILADARDKANIIWLRKSFSLAKKEDAGAVVISMHADINILRAEYFEERYEYGKPCAGATKNARTDNCDAFVGLRVALLNEVKNFDGPVLLIHGDTRPFALAKIFTEGGESSDLWSLNVAGDAKCVNGRAESISNATVVKVNLRSSHPFDASRLLDREFLCQRSSGSSPIPSDS